MKSGVHNPQSVTNQVNHDLAETAAKAKAKKLGLPYLDLGQAQINPDSLKYIDESAATLNFVLPFEIHGNTIRIVTPFPERPSTEKIRGILTNQKLEVEIFVCSDTSFASALKAYQSRLAQRKSISKPDESKTAHQNPQFYRSAFKALETQQTDIAISTILEQVEILSTSLSASDIHFQPEDNHIDIRLRINGTLESVAKISAENSPRLIMHIKYEAGMKSNITDVPQDGRISRTINGRPIEFRVSTLPMDPFESIVFRILDSRRGIRSFQALGFEDFIAQQMTAALQQKSGIVLVTGPTGSGKTTTLYSMLKELNDSERKLVTLEDPVEYHLDGVTQSQVNRKGTYNFENGFAAILRHDPDVIMVGEIRTISTAKLAFEAALTGHTVLASLHTNSATGAIARLRNMGMENFNIAPTINAVFAQKLIRTLDKNRAKPTEASEKRRLGKMVKTAEIIQKYPNVGHAIERLQKVFPTLKISAPVGRSLGEGGEILLDTDDHQLDFGGQTAICEAFSISDDIREMILAQNSEVQIRQHLYENTNFLSLFEHGVYKVLKGETTLMELFRVAGMS